MHSRTFNVLVILTFFVGLIGTAVPGQAAPPGPDPRPAPVGEDIREMEASPAKVAGSDLDVRELESEAASAASASSLSSCVLDTKIFLYLDNTIGFFVPAAFNLLAESDNSQIWVQADLSWPEGDPRPTPEITCEQAEYMMGQFDNEIYPVETDFFTTPDLHDGSSALLPLFLGLPADYYADPQGRQVVLVSNVRDQNFYDPDFPLYIAGFYTDAFEVFFDRNTMTIDAFNWEDRTGPDAERPFLYEGVFAHEYQHLLHSDSDGDEVNWINEGLSDWAEPLTGYPVPESHVEAASSNPENSLTAWQDQGGLEILTDYGLAYLFMEWMHQQYGDVFIKELFLNPANGISGVNAALAEIGADTNFADSYHEYSTALYRQGAFEFEDLAEFQVDAGHPGQRNPEAHASPGAPPWGADYVLFWGQSRIENLRFNGMQFNPTPWTSDGEVLWGNTGNLIDNFAIFEAEGGETLTFDTKYDIESGWDFGFVQVSSDGGETWTSLSNEFTTDVHNPSAHPDIIANMPGLTGHSSNLDEADDEGWVTMSFDLPENGGDPILVAFRYMTDWAFTEDGWFVDNVLLDGELVSDGSSTDPFQSLNEVLEISNEFTVQLIGERIRRGQPQYETKTILSGDFIAEWDEVRGMFSQYRWVVMTVTYDAPEGSTTYAGYDYELVSTGGKPFPKK